MCYNVDNKVCQCIWRCVPMCVTIFGNVCDNICQCDRSNVCQIRGDCHPAVTMCYNVHVNVCQCMLQCVPMCVTMCVKYLTTATQRHPTKYLRGDDVLQFVPMWITKCANACDNMCQIPGDCHPAASHNRKESGLLCLHRCTSVCAHISEWCAYIYKWMLTILIKL